MTPARPRCTLNVMTPRIFRRAAALFFAAAVLGACAFDPDMPERYALVYGVADYAGDTNDLEFPDDDASAMHGLFMAKGFSTVPGGTVLRTDAAATKAALAADIAAVAALAEKDSLFVFYFSGHGASFPSAGAEPYPQDEYNEFIYLYDPAAILDGGVRDDELMALISQVPSRQKVVIIDACNSGGFIGWSPDVDTIPAEYTGSLPGALSFAGDAFAKYFANPEAGDIPYDQAIVMTAAGERELAYEDAVIGPYQHGIFTYFLLQCPRSGDRNGDGYVTATEAYAYAKKKIESEWNSAYVSYSNFLPHISGGALDFVLFEAD